MSIPNIVPRVRSATPFSFTSDIVATKHLRQFSSRIAGSGAGALAGSVTIAANAVTAIALSVGGSNYSTVTTRVLIVGDGTGAAATATISAGAITGFTVTAGGSGYTTATAYVVDGPVVVVVGDSISTEEPSPANFGASLWYLLTGAIDQANPRRNITYFNRAVGSQSWTTFNSVANTNYPAWYSNTSKDWMDYIEELQPDLVFCAFGMNDRENFVFAEMQAAIAKLVAFSPEPDVIIATTMVPSAISDSTDISSVAAQNGRDACSAYMRGWSLKEGYGFLDFNRRSRLVRDGVDVRSAALRLKSNAASVLPWTASTAAQSDFSVEATFTSVSSWTSQILTFYLGTQGANTLTELRIDDNAGKVRLTIRDRQVGTGGTTNQEVLTSTLTSPTGTVVFGVLAQDQRLLVSVNGTVIYAKIIARFAGEFYPYVSAAVSWGTPTISYCAGEFAQYAQRAGDEELWGSTGAGSYGGNEYNHPSSIAVALMIAPVIYETDWSHSPMTIGGDSNGVTTNIGVGEPDPLARLHVTKTQMSTETLPASDANNLLLEDATDAGLTLLVNDGGACRFKMGDTSNVSQWVEAFAHSSNQHTEVHGSTTIRTTTATVDAWGVPVRMPSYTFSGKPDAATMGAGAMIFCSNATGGAVVAFSNGTNWLRCDTSAILS